MSEPPVVNIGDVVAEPDEGDPPGYRNRAVRLGPLLAAQSLGATLYELDPGQSVCPYHYEYGREEWMIVLEGSPLLRTPAGDERVRAGGVVLFPEGPDGAHKVTNVADPLVRILMLSTMGDPSVAVYPDSGKIGVWPPGKLFRESDAVDYWVGETPER